MSLLNYNKGRSGFGLNALTQARDAGLSDRQIQRQAAQLGLQIGPAASLSLGANPTMHAFAQPGSSGFGAGALQRAQAAGMTNAEIRSNLADSGLHIGDKAAKILNDLINNQGHKVFVNCTAGVSRSPTLIIIYIALFIQHKSWDDIEQIYEFLETEYPWQDPNVKVAQIIIENKHDFQ